jgi:sulfate adenylyltransferase
MIRPIAPHGGVLINQELHDEEKLEALDRAAGLKKLALTEREVCDLEMIATGAMSPLTGFMKKDDYESVITRMHLANGLPWTIPVTKQISDAERSSLRIGEEVALATTDGMVLALMKVEEVFPHDKKEHALKVYRTDEAQHPGVAAVNAMGDYLAGGEIFLINRPPHKDFLPYRLDPAKTRGIFAERAWKRIVAFQTRNPIHRAHEYLTKCALEMADGLLVHPLVGQTKGDDIPADVRMKCYEVLIEKYFAKSRVMLSVFPASMRYAGPREAIFHALVRKNYGCTHFIVGRDHAGVSRPDGKPYYGSFDAHHIFDEFDPEKIGITPLFFDFTFYCQTCGEMASTKTCPHDPTHHLTLSGTKVRETLRHGELPPPEYSRPEVASILIEAMRQEAARR